MAPGFYGPNHLSFNGVPRNRAEYGFRGPPSLACPPQAPWSTARPLCSGRARPPSWCLCWLSSVPRWSIAAQCKHVPRCRSRSIRRRLLGRYTDRAGTMSTADIHTSRVLLRHGEIPAGGWRCFWITGSMVQTGKMTGMQAAAKGHDGHLAQLSQAVGRGLHFDHPVLEGRQRRHHQCQCLDQLNRMGGRAPIPANDKSSAFNSVVAGSVTIFTIQVNINNADARSQALQIARPVGTSNGQDASRTSDAFKNTLTQISKLRVAK